MRVPLLDLGAQYASIRDEVRAAVDAVLESQHFILGTEVAALEEEVARYCGVPHAVGVASGTDALLLGLRALGVGPGDAVVTVAYTFFATAGAIVNAGARPIFVDVDEASFNMSVEHLERVLSEDCAFRLPLRTLVHKLSGAMVRAIVPVHLFGQCAEMNEIVEIARRYDLPVLEDAAQAIGARYGEARAGSLGDAAAFSFFPSKNLGGAGDGGMVVTHRPDVAERVRLLRAHGAKPKYFHKLVGYNSRLDELQAAVLRVKLRYLDAWAEGRARNAARYTEELEATGLSRRVIPPPVLPRRTHVFNQYVIRAPKRNELQAHLKERGIGTEVYYPRPLHVQECFSSLGYAAADLPRSVAAADDSLALPVYPELTAEQRAHVVSSIAEFYAEPAARTGDGRS